MKKFYAFAAAAVAALSMNAQLYVVGAGEGLNWAPEAPMTIEAGADGNYTFDINQLSAFKMSTAMGDWDTFNAGALYANMTEELLGTPVALEINGDPNINAPWKGDYHIVVAGDHSTITMTTTTPKPVGFTPVYIRGAMNEWGASELWQFTTEDGKTYKFEAKGETMIPAGVEFKIADADWGPFCNYSAGGVITINEPTYWIWDDQTNSTVAEDFEGLITFTMPEEAHADLEVLFDDQTSVSAIEIAEGEVEYFNLQGVRVANPDNGLYIVRQGNKVMKQVIR